MKRIFLLLILTTYFSLSHAQLKLAQIFGDHMVLQQGQQIPVWGWANPEETITLNLNGYTLATQSDAEGKWKAYFPPMKAGGPYALSVQGKAEELQLSDVLIGEVWFASGQSNMEWRVRNANDAKAEIAAADYPNIRLFKVPKVVSREALADLSEGDWVACSPETIADFTAVGYFFGRKIHLDQNVPVGLISSSWGGTPSEAWTSLEMLYADPDFNEEVRDTWASSEDYQQGQMRNDSLREVANEILATSNRGHELGVTNPAFDDANWKEMEVPIHYHNTPEAGFRGYMWFRKTIDVPKEVSNKDLTLYLGKIEWMDTTWFNGTMVGNTANSGLTRVYEIPSKLVKAGKNVITIKVKHLRDHGGGMYDAPHRLVYQKAGETQWELALSGVWKYNEKIEAELPRITTTYPHLAASLFNGMVAPVIPYGIRGVIWYQGENNANRAYQYRRIFPLMIHDWRIRWKQGNFPFLFVQLANFLDIKPEPSADPWPELREAQTMTLDLPNTAMAVAIDIGDANDIHPRNKQEVGRRLALAAEHKVYGQNIVYSGPKYERMEKREGKILIHFTEVGEGLKTKSERPVTGFSIAGPDQQFVWAEARILDKHTLEVFHPEIDYPQAVRYAWANNPVCNLINSADLPAIPFRTDQWPGVTLNNK